MAKATFPETTGNISLKPATSGSNSSSDMRNALSALFQGDLAPLRPRAQATPDMTVAVNSAIVESYFQQVWNGRLIVSYAGGNSGAISAPSANPRIDILYLTSAGALAWVTGDEAGSPVAKWASLPDDSIPIALVYCVTTMTKIYNYEDKDTYPTHGYIYRDIRPLFGMVSIG